MWQRHEVNTVRKMALPDLFNAGLPQNFTSYVRNLVSVMCKTRYVSMLQVEKNAQSFNQPQTGSRQPPRDLDSQVTAWGFFFSPDPPSTHLNLLFLSPNWELLGVKDRDCHFLNPTSTQQAKQRFIRQTDRDFISSLTPWISVRRQMRGTVCRRQVTLLLSLHNIVFYLCCGKLTYTLTWDVTFSTPVTHHKSPFPGASGKGEGQGGPLL